MAAIVRRTVHEASALEVEQATQRERRLEEVLDAKMVAVSELVADLQHEVNNPLGALRSATDTARRAAKKAAAAQATPGDDQAKRTERAMGVLESSLALSDQAAHGLRV